MQAVVQVRADRHSQVFLSNTSSVYGLPRLRITVFTHVWKIGLPPCAETAKSGKPQEPAGGVKGAYRPLASHRQTGGFGRPGTRQQQLFGPLRAAERQNGRTAEGRRTLLSSPPVYKPKRTPRRKGFLLPYLYVRVMLPLVTDRRLRAVSRVDDRIVRQIEQLAMDRIHQSR